MNTFDKIKFLFHARKPALEIYGQIKDIKTKWKKIRFWTLLISSLLALLAAIQGLIPVEIAIITSAALTFFYNLFQAFKDADEVGFSPLLRSSKVWMSVINSCAIALTTLETGGVNASWVTGGISVIATITMISREIATMDPTAPKNGDPDHTSPIP